MPGQLQFEDAIPRADALQEIQIVQAAELQRDLLDIRQIAEEGDIPQIPLVVIDPDSLQAGAARNGRKVPERFRIAQIQKPQQFHLPHGGNVLQILQVELNAVELLQSLQEREVLHRNTGEPHGPQIRTGFQTGEIGTASVPADQIEFLLSANTGEPLRPLSKVASGGELSRIMLAFKCIEADVDAIPVLVFDEVDTGISGRTAQKVSEKMAAIAEHRQVICITHLPQIAAMADQHFEIEKHGDEVNGTETQIHLLNEEDSVRELARLLGGAAITPAVPRYAPEPLGTLPGPYHS